MTSNGDKVRVDAEDARAGQTRHMVRYVLGVSLFLAILAMTIAWVAGALAT